MAATRRNDDGHAKRDDARSKHVDYARLLTILPQIAPLLVGVREHMLSSTNRVHAILEKLTSTLAELRGVLEELDTPPSEVRQIKALLAAAETGPRKPREKDQPVERVTSYTGRASVYSGSVKDRVRKFFSMHPENTYRSEDVCRELFPAEYENDRARIDVAVRKAFSALYRCDPPELLRLGNGQYRWAKTKESESGAQGA